MLDFIVKGAKKAGFAITVKKVKTIVRQWRRATWLREERKEPR